MKKALVLLLLVISILTISSAVFAGNGCPICGNIYYHSLLGDTIQQSSTTPCSYCGIDWGTEYYRVVNNQCGVCGYCWSDLVYWDAIYYCPYSGVWYSI